MKTKNIGLLIAAFKGGDFLVYWRMGKVDFTGNYRYDNHVKVETTGGIAKHEKMDDKDRNNTAVYHHRVFSGIWSLFHGL